MNFKDITTRDICQLINCPHCSNGDLVDIIHSESLLTLRPEKQWFTATCRNCNKISMVDYTANSENPQISITSIDKNIEEYLEDLNKEFIRVLGTCDWYPFKVEDYTKK